METSAAPIASEGLSVTLSLEADHRLFESQLEQLQSLVGARKFEEARVLFAEFAAGLHGHLEAEEWVLFLVFEEVTGIANGPTKALRCEHCTLQKLIDSTSAFLAFESPSELDALLGSLREMLKVHHSREEEVLFPICNRAVKDEIVREVLVSRMAERKAMGGAMDRASCSHGEHEHGHADDGESCARKLRVVAG